MLTAKDGDLDEAEALDTGADDYLTKPFSFPVLVARLHALARRAGASAVAQVTAGDLRIDPVTHRVVRGDIEVKLSAHEFDLLEYLMRRSGQVLTKDQIIDSVWDISFDGNPNIVEVYVSRLRQKIDAPFERHHDGHCEWCRLPVGGQRWLIDLGDVCPAQGACGFDSPRSQSYSRPQQSSLGALPCWLIRDRP